MYLTDRSRIITQQTCPRKRYLQYEYQGRGIEKAGLSKDLFTGICVHKGLEYLLSLHIGIHYNPPIHNDVIDKSVEVAINYYDQECQSNNFFGVQDNEQSFLYLELRALIEALIRVYAKVQLPRLLEEFEVLEVEREYIYELVPSYKPNPADIAILDEKESDSIILMSRPDALLRERSSGNLYIMSFKTASSYDSRTDEQNRYDMQGISEVVAVEAALAQLRQKPYIQMSDQEHELSVASNLHKVDQPKISGVKMEYLIKGIYSTCDSDNGPVARGMKFTNNYLIHPYYSEAVDDFSYFYKWTDAENKNRTLGKGWRRVNLWERSPTAIKDWIDILFEDQERNPLEKVIATPEVYFRHDVEIKDWLEQTKYQEMQVRQSAYNVNELASPGDDFRRELNREFPQYRHSCFNYNSPCQFIEICWKGDSPEDDTYRERTPNHEIERTKFSV